MPRVALFKSSIAQVPKSDTPIESECFIPSESARSAYFSIENPGGERDLAREVCDGTLKKYGKQELC